MFLACAIHGLTVGGGFIGHGTAMRMQSVRMQELTPALIDLGCDEELWSEVRNKQALLDLVDSGDMKKAQDRVDFLRRVTSSESPPLKSPNHGKYVQAGAAPGVDVA